MGLLRRWWNREGEDTTIGGVLLRLGFITRDQLRSAITTKLKATPETLLGEILVAQGAVTRVQLERALIQQEQKRGRVPDYAARVRDLIAGVHAQSETIQAHLDAMETAARDMADDPPQLLHLKRVRDP